MTPCRVVALCGLPGSGKSTLAGFLCERFKLAGINRDRLRAELFPHCRFTDVEKRAANQAVLQHLTRHCAAGESALVDGMTLARASEREALKRIALGHGFRFVLLWLDCPVETAVVRVEHQAHLAQDRDAARVREVAARFEAPADAVRIDAALAPKTIQQLAAQALAS